jgi:hypothetical protein
MVMNAAGPGILNDWPGECEQSCKRQRGRPTSINPKLSDSNRNLVLGPPGVRVAPRQSDRLTVGRDITFFFVDET